MSEPQKAEPQKPKPPSRICVNCGDPASCVLTLGDHRYPKCGSCFGETYQPRWELAAISIPKRVK